ncbi:MAG: type IV pilus assembly protein PilM [Candidatus Gottesmanbacteria bacterium]|nr:type IV pilus assembly protein PilM [Candidatus Gottesmanbacteria bacterium]
MNLSLGLDIGSHAIKLIELGFEGNSVGLVAAGSIPTPPKALTSTVTADTEAVAQTIKRLIKETGAKSKEVHIALPESKVFTRVIEVPALSERELTSAIRWEAEQYVPLPLDQVNLDFTILRDAKVTGTNKMEVLLVAAPKTLLDKYLSILEMAELQPVSAETEIIATTRALTRSTPNIQCVMIVSLGAQTTDIAILRNGTLAFTRSLPAGGDALTRALAQSLDFNLTQAEEFKRTYGVQPDKLEGKIVAAAKPITDTIVTESKRAMAFYQEKFKEDHVQLVLLSGGIARLPGMVVLLAQSLGVEVQFANPWVGIARTARFNVLNTEGPNFCVAVGLALRR